MGFVAAYHFVVDVCHICAVQCLLNPFLCFINPPHQAVPKVVSQLQISSSVFCFVMQNQDSLNQTSASFAAPCWVLPKETTGFEDWKGACPVLCDPCSNEPHSSNLLHHGNGTSFWFWRWFQFAVFPTPAQLASLLPSGTQ